MILRRFGFAGGGSALLIAASILSLLLAACGMEDSVAPAQSPTVASNAAAPASAPKLTDVPTATPRMATQEPTEPAPTATPILAKFQDPDPEPVAEATPAEPDGTATPEPTATQASPATPEQAATATPAAEPDATATPEPTATPQESWQESCEGEPGGEVGNCAPEFAGTQEWINSEALTMEGLRGKVVLIDFWTYSCINCIRTLPFLQSWHQRYANEGLVIVGVHTPEFEFETLYDNVVDATVEMGVAWPVVQDNGYVVWGSYDNRFWPAKYLVDQDGVIRYRHFGEGKYAETEEEIRKLLAEIGAEADALAQPLPEDQMRDSTYLSSDARRTPELFAGWTFVNSHYQSGRGLYVGQADTYQHAAQQSYQAGDRHGVVAEFVQPAQLRPDVIYFHGPWSIGPESAVHARETEEYMDAIILVYSARSVNAVLTSESGEPYKVLVTVGNRFLTEENRGEDVVIGDNGESYVMVTSPKAYRLVEHANFEEGRILAMSSLSNDFGLFSFTFGTYEDGF